MRGTYQEICDICLTDPHVCFTCLSVCLCQTACHIMTVSVINPPPVYPPLLFLYVSPPACLIYEDLMSEQCSPRAREDERN